MRFGLRRLGFFALTLWAALTLNFFLPRLMPGNPALAMMSKFRGPINPQAYKALAVAFGLNNHQSLFSQYVTYLGDVATCKFGTSLYFYPQSVGRVVLQAAGRQADDNPCFGVTSLTAPTPPLLYADLYGARGTC